MWLHAWALGTISGLSLPIGAILGILLTPVRDDFVAAMMALGAGALLFAVTVELYGHALRELEFGRAGILEMIATVAGALVGAIFYLAVNRWLEQTMVEPLLDELEDGAESAMSSERSPILSSGRFRRQTSAPSAVSFGSTVVTEYKAEKEAGSPNRCTSDRMSINRGGSFHSTIGGSELSHLTQTRGRDKALLRSINLQSLASPSNSTQGNESPREAARKGKQVAFALFVGLLVDGVPEGILMGFLAAEGHLSAVFVVSLFVANFPEAFSSASLMRQGEVGVCWILTLWCSLCLGVGALAGGSCFLLQQSFPTYPHGENLPQALLLTVAVVEGITGGAMIACIATVMLPEAFERAGKAGPLWATSGFLCTTGFLLAVVMKALEHHYNNTKVAPELHGNAFNIMGFLL